MTTDSLHYLSWLMVLVGITSSLVVALDIRRCRPQSMAVMRYVWPINALWAGVFGVWAYWSIGRTGPLLQRGASKETSPQSMPGMDMSMKQTSPPFWQSIVSGTLHCGAGVLSC